MIKEIWKPQVKTLEEDLRIMNNKANKKNSLDSRIILKAKNFPFKCKKS